MQRPEPPTARRGPASYLPASPIERRLLLMTFVDALGSGLYLAGSAVFFTRSADLTPSQIGVGLAAGAILGLVTVFPIGLLADTTGPKIVLVGLCAWRAAGFAGYALVGSFPAFLAVVCFLGPADKAMAPVTQALVAAATGQERRVQTMGYVRAVRNAGFTIGGLLVTIPLHLDTRLAYDGIMLGDAASFVLTGWMAARLPTREAPPRVARRDSPLTALRDRRYLLLTALNGVLMLQLTMLTVAIPLWLLQHTRAPRVLIGPLLAVNTVLVVILQVRASRQASSIGVAARLLARSGIAFGVSALLVGLSAAGGSFAAAAILVAAVVSLTLGEVQQAAGGWRVSFDLAPEKRRGSYLALFGLGVSLQTIVGPPLFTAVVLPAGMPGWAGIAALFALTGLLAAALLRDAR